MSATVLILASTSSSRRAMLERAGVEFSTLSPGVDEAPLCRAMQDRGAGPAAIASGLAEAKALAVSRQRPDAFVIGADQTLVCEGELIHKAEDRAQAASVLRRLRGRTHELHCAAALARRGAILWTGADSVRMSMRDFSDAFLERYLDAEMPGMLASVGCYRIEGRGAQLFSAAPGDHFTIRGLPLMALLQALREQGGLPS
jgi:septum formation protein